MHQILHSALEIPEQGNDPAVGLEARLHDIMIHALRAPGNTARLREAGLVLEDGNGKPVLVDEWREKFSRIRPLERQEVRRSPHTFLAALDHVGYRGVTSGSRSESLIYFASETWNRIRLACRKRALERWRISEDTPIINLCSRLRPAGPNDIGLGGDPDADQIETLAALLERRRCVVRGYPSRLTAFARMWARDGDRVVAVITTGECLYAYQKKILEETFHAPVINEYGCHETGISAIACPACDGLILDHERCFFEIVGGELVTTDLHNTIMPMVRYKCGDRVERIETGCACGAMLRVLGRSDDRIRTTRGVQPAGGVHMPWIPGISDYFARLKGDEVSISANLGKDASQTEASRKLSEWAVRTFEAREIEVSLFPWNAAPSGEKYCSEQTWADTVQNGQWFEDNAFRTLPPGPMRPYAALFRDLVSPRLLTAGFGCAVSTRDALTGLLASPSLHDPILERLAARILLLGCAHLHPRDTRRSTLLSLAISRLDNALLEDDESGRADLAIARILLCGEPQWEAAEAWQAVNHLVPDRFSVHLLMQALEFAWHQAAFSSPRPLVMSGLKPLMAVLIADAVYFAPCFGAWLLAVWRSMLDGCTDIITSHHRPADAFVARWMTLRSAYTRDEKTLDRAVAALREAARTDEERARCDVEEGYALLMAGKSLDPLHWIGRFNNAGEVLPMDSEPDTIDAQPWAPILRVIAPLLFEFGEREMAYHCMVASTAPSSRISAFDRMTRRVNNKVTVLHDAST